MIAMIGKWLVTSGAALPSLSTSLAQVTIKQAGTRNWVVEVLVVVALFGLALFVICKSSRRV
jgi:hypothetical protein